MATSSDAWYQLTSIDYYPVDIDSIIAAAPPIDGLEQYGYVYLLDKSDVRLDHDFTYVASVTAIVLITSPEGTREFGSYLLRYKEGMDSVSVSIAKSTAPDGTTHEVPEDDLIYDISPSDLMKNDLYTDSRELRINFSGLEIGSVVCLKITKRHYRPIIPGFCFWFRFDMTVPSLFSAMSINHPSDLDLKSQSHMMDGMTPRVTIRDGRRTEVWLRSDNTVVVSEPGSIGTYSRSAHVGFTTYPTWSDFAQHVYDSLWMDDLQSALGECERMLLRELQLSDESSYEKMRRIYYLVQKDIRYLGLGMGVNNLKPFPSSVICTKRYGDCKDQSNLLIKLLAEAGIPAEPAIAASVFRVYDLDTLFPLPSLLDHALVYVPNVDGASYWLDPTLNWAKIGYMSPSYHNVNALLLRNRGFVRIPLTSGEMDYKRFHVRRYVDSSGTGYVDQVVEVGGIFAWRLKHHYNRLDEKERAKQAALAVSEGDPNVRDIECFISGLTDFDSAFVFETRYVVDDYFRRSGDLLIRSGDFSPAGHFDNSGGLETRETDLYLGFTPHFEFEAIVTYPDEFEVVSLPRSSVVDCAHFVWQQEFVLLPDNQIQSRGILTVKDPYVPVERYQEYRQCMKDAARLGSETTVLKLKAN